MKIKFDQKKLLLFFIIIVSSLILTSLFIQNYKIIKINSEEKKTEIRSDKIIDYLKSKKINTNLDTETLKKIYWVERIKDGGLILLFRHSEREKWNSSVEGFDAFELQNNLNARNLSWYKATCLTPKGIEESKLIKEAFKHAQIKISKVISSPSCRAKETALYSFERIDEIFTGLLHYTAFHPLDRKKIGYDLKKAVQSIKIKKDSNIILSAHNKVISHEGFIDEMNVDEGLSESGFYIIENINGKLKVPFKFSQIKNFVILLYRHDFQRKNYQ